MLRKGLAAFFLAALVAAPAWASACREDQVQLRGSSGTAAFSVEVVDTPETRARGLMFVESMPRFSGMLFVFEQPQRAVFWMENTLIPLDMLFVDERGVVQTLHENAVPLDRTGIDGGPGILYVLEINGGMASRLRLGPGTELRHPSIDPALAAWPCE